MISAIILAAGESKRMGKPKMLLPWKDDIVLRHVISIYKSAGVEDILVVTGAMNEQIEKAIAGINIRAIHNKGYLKGEMLSSIQCGIRAMTDQTQGILIGLGDQPQVQKRSVQMICDAFLKSKSAIVVPSYQMRRGHPWLVARPLWTEILNLHHPHSLRDFLNAYGAEIEYVATHDPNILADIDTPEDYQKWHS